MIRHVLGSGRALTLQGVVITEELWNEVLAALAPEEPAHVRASIICTGAVFRSKLRLVGRTFAGSVWLAGAVLEDGCEVRETHFLGGLGLDFADFGNGAAYFKDCSVKGSFSASYGQAERQHLAFASTSIDSDVRAEGFVGDLRFERCEISGGLDARNGAFKVLILDRSTIGGDLDLREAEADRLRGTWLTVEGTVAMQSLVVKGACDLSNARLNARSDVTVDAERLNLTGVGLPRGGNLEVRRADIVLKHLSLGGPLAVVGLEGASVSSMWNADASLLRFAGVDLSRCVFYGAHGLDRTSIESTTVVLPRAPGLLRTGRRCIADEFAWRARHSRWRRSDWEISGTTLLPRHPDSDELEGVALPDLTPGQVAGVYRSLRKSFEDQGNEPGASDFYYGEMEMRRVDKTASTAERLIVFLYWAVAGYGLRALRVLAWLAALIILGAILLMHFGFATGSPGFIDSLLSAVESAVPGVSDVRKLTTLGRVIDLSLTILGPALLAFFVLALRNRVKR